MAPGTTPFVALAEALVPELAGDAEVLIDALCWIAGDGESYWSPIPEPFTFIPEHQRSIALADGSITSPFLELFGRGVAVPRLERQGHVLDAVRHQVQRSEDVV